jgi:hypothetical protein
VSYRLSPTRDASPLDREFALAAADDTSRETSGAIAGNPSGEPDGVAGDCGPADMSWTVA